MPGKTTHILCQENGRRVGEASTLSYVSLYAASRPTTLAIQMNVEPMAPVTCLARLESHCLIARQPDPTGRRAKIVQLTPDAQPMLEQVVRITRKVQERATQDFRLKVVEVLRNLLNRMRVNIAATQPGREQE